MRVCGLDISGDSIEAAKERFVSPKMKGGSSNPPFSAEFFTTDCTKVRHSLAKKKKKKKKEPEPCHDLQNFNF